MTKRLGPYNTLMNEALSWANKWRCRKRTPMFYYRQAQAEQHFGSLYERVLAAQQLDHEVCVTVNDDGELHFHYVPKGPKDVPLNWSWR